MAFGSRELADYNQSHLPVREQREAVGHAVRAVYLLSLIHIYGQREKHFDGLAAAFL